MELLEVASCLYQTDDQGEGGDEEHGSWTREEGEQGCTREVAYKDGCMQDGNVMTIVSPSLTVMKQPALRQVRQMVN